jgi:creatinine amidohydrolase
VLQSQLEHRVSHLTWDAVSARLAAGAPAILPIGAGAKQHGFHLPMQTDQLQAEWLAERVAVSFNGLIWPTVTYGFYPAFEAYAGSISLTEKMFEELVLESANGLLKWCRSHIFVLDTGISTQPAMLRACARSAEPSRCHHIKVYGGPSFQDAAARLARQPHGSHADEIETSLMLALAPERVQMARAIPSKALPGGVINGALTPFDPASPNYSASGSFGSPQLATPEKGKHLLAAMEADVLAAVKQALKG